MDETAVIAGLLLAFLIGQLGLLLLIGGMG